jgi:hypothetical protein
MTLECEASETALSLHHYRILGADLQVYDFAESQAAPYAAQELASDSYELRRIPSRPGDCVVDIGGHLGGVSLSLAQVFARHDIKWRRLLKIDCEGLEYEVLSATSIWNRVDRLCGEFHTNEFLKSRNCSLQALSKFCAQRLAPDRVAVSFCRMSE